MPTKGKYAFGFCDRTGFRYKLKDLVDQQMNGRPSGIRVGKDIVDIDNEQYRLNEINMSEDISLRNPRPDQTLVETRAMVAWNPVGGGVTAFGSRTVGLTMIGAAGSVTIGG